MVNAARAGAKAEPAARPQGYGHVQDWLPARPLQRAAEHPGRGITSGAGRLQAVVRQGRTATRSGNFPSV